MTPGILRFALSFLCCLVISIPAAGQIPQGTTPAPTNISLHDCPCIHPDLRVTFTVNAPAAGKVQIDLGKLYDMQKAEDGIWSVTTDPQLPGFHYYSLVIDGLKVADPASESFYGTGRMSSAIDIPETGADFLNTKDVPHGEVRSRVYFSRVTNTWRPITIYTPPGYDNNQSTQYPALYIQHGGGEDERGWAAQGKTATILDNLIAERKATPMLVVMPNGNVTRPNGTAPGYTDEAMTAFRDELFESIIPFVEANYRVRPEAASRAIAGLSMGGGQAFFTGLRNLDRFSAVGVFSTGLFGGIPRPGAEPFDPEKTIPGLTTTPARFNNSLQVFYLSVGEQDPRFEHTRNLVRTLRGNGLKVVFSSFPGGHEWQVWRKSLHDFAPLLFHH